jgi:hypothetical protein
MSVRAHRGQNRAAVAAAAVVRAARIHADLATNIVCCFDVRAFVVVKLQLRISTT